jgi:hypothetical protein
MAAVLSAPWAVDAAETETLSTSDTTTPMLGPLASLIGTWTGDNGLNIVAVPSRKSMPTDTGRFELLVRPYREVLTFVAVPEPVRNRGGNLDQFIGALEYRQEVYAIDDNTELIHVENGMLFYLDNIQNYDGSPADKPRYSIARSATIPHGNTAMLFGTYRETNGGPIIRNIDAAPMNAGINAPSEYKNPYLKPMDVTNPNTFLQDVIAKQEIQRTIHLTLDSGNEGSVTSVPFLVDRADTTRFGCDFWIETLRDGSQQLQYSQEISIAFHHKIGGLDNERIRWPHITVNTLKRGVD